MNIVIITCPSLIKTRAIKLSNLLLGYAASVDLIESIKIITAGDHKLDIKFADYDYSEWDNHIQSISPYLYYNIISC